MNCTIWRILHFHLRVLVLQIVFAAKSLGERCKPEWNTKYVYPLHCGYVNNDVNASDVQHCE